MTWWSFGSALKYFLMVRRAFSDKDDGKVGSGGRRSPPTGRLWPAAVKRQVKDLLPLGLMVLKRAGLRDLAHTCSISVSKYVRQAR